MKSKKIVPLNSMQIQIHNEDHTLMNVLKWCISNGWANQHINCNSGNSGNSTDNSGNNIDSIDASDNINSVVTPVDFCGYTIPHPSEPISLLTVQFVDEDDQSVDNALGVIKAGSKNIEEISDKLLGIINKWTY